LENLVSLQNIIQSLLRNGRLRRKLRIMRLVGIGGGDRMNVAWIAEQFLWTLLIPIGVVVVALAVLLYLVFKR